MSHDRIVCMGAISVSQDYDRTIEAAYSLQQFVEANEETLQRRRDSEFVRDMKAHAFSMQASSYR